MTGRPAGGATPALAALRRARVPHILHPYDVSPTTPDYGRAVADALGTDPARVFKTLVADRSGALLVAVVPVTGELDLKALAAATAGLPGAPPGRRVSLADRAAAERATGYVRGGISPLGQRRQLPTVIDSSAAGLESMLVSAGRRGLQVELAPAELVRLTGATLAPIAR